MEEFLEKTFIAVKHDGVQRGLVGEIIKRFEQRGLRLCAIKMILPDEELAKKHYPLTEEWIKNNAANTRKAWAKKGITLEKTDEELASQVNSWLKDYLMEGPVVAMVWEGLHAINIGRKLVGPANTKEAPPGTIRGDFTVDSYEIADKKQRPVRNIIHASGNPTEAENEISLWFKPEEIHDWTKKEWNIMH